MGNKPLGWHLLRFDATVSPEMQATPLILRFDVYVEGLPILALRPEVELVSRDGAAPIGSSFTEEMVPSMAFASYAREDRRVVLGRIRSLQIFTGIDVFLDCLSIRPGEQWKEALRHEIERRDLFWLFWSRAAMASKWVDWEWRTAVAPKSLSCIQPHPLEPVEEAPPPEELADLQFGAFYETYLAATKEAWLPRRFRRLKKLVTSKLGALRPGRPLHSSE